MVFFVFVGALLAYHGFDGGNFLAGIVGILIAIGAGMCVTIRKSW